MIAKLNEYIEKLEEIKKNSLDDLLERWNPKNELFLKVDEKGNYKEFKGDTIIFFLNDEDKKKITLIQKELYEKLGNLLAKPLSEKFFHMTLHDLCNYNITKDVENCMKKNEKKVKKILNDVKINKSIKMKSIGLYNGGSAIGIMFSPKDEKDLSILLESRKKFDELIEQKNFYIPHVTLGYYLPIDYNGQKRAKIFETIKMIKYEIEITLDFKKLEYVHFTNMDNYIIK